MLRVAQDGYGSMLLKKGLDWRCEHWFRLVTGSGAVRAMMGQQTGDQSQLFYLFNVEERIPARQLGPLGGAWPRTGRQGWIKVGRTVDTASDLDPSRSPAQC